MRADDPGLKAALEDPGIQEVIRSRRAVESVERAIQETSGKQLKAWVTVALWEDEDGGQTETVIKDGHSNFYEIRGLLHDAVWSTAHEE